MSTPAKFISQLKRHAEKVSGAVEREQTATAAIIDTVLAAGLEGVLTPTQTETAVKAIEQLVIAQGDPLVVLYDLFGQLEHAVESRSSLGLLPRSSSAQSGVRRAVRARR